MNDSTLLLVGLGNPGLKHANNRHNAGFMALDAIRNRYASSLSDWQDQYLGKYCSGTIQQNSVALLKPYALGINDSGRSVAQAQEALAIETSRIFVFHDEMDLKPGVVRKKTGGGTAGHLGLESIQEQIFTNFHRIRIGIGRPAEETSVIDHVLGDFLPSDETWLKPLLAGLAGFVPTLLDSERMNYKFSVKSDSA